ncbi:MAG TPA: glycosyltransferase family 4 protein [Allosphingosinicella sp.]
MIAEPGGARGGAATAPLRLLIISSNGSWGGSEALWSQTALRLAKAGHRVTAIKGPMERHEPAIARLAAAGVTLIDMARLPLVPKRLLDRVANLSWPLSYLIRRFRLFFALRRPYDLVLISQGTNLDGLLAGKRVRRRGLRYGILVHKATAYDWPVGDIYEDLRAFYREARFCLFVSEANRALTEEQIGMRLPHAEVVRNPCSIARGAAIGWPFDETLFRLACVGRLFPREKGQDLLLRVLGRDKWKNRPLAVSFFGGGDNAAALRGMAELLGARATFAGHGEPEAIWAAHHALVVPSRSEGLPMVVAEAMMAGRIAIVTPAGGTAEIVQEGATGFVAETVSEDALDAALERAWQRRHEWRAIGEAAAAAIRQLMPEDPVGFLADRLVAEARTGHGAAV